MLTQSIILRTATVAQYIWQKADKLVFKIRSLNHNTQHYSNWCLSPSPSLIYSHQLNILKLYRVSQEERAKLREGVPYVKLYQYNPKHLYPKLNGYGDNGKRSLKL